MHDILMINAFMIFLLGRDRTEAATYFLEQSGIFGECRRHLYEVLVHCVIL